jgi:protein transport protein SEC31
LELYDLNFGNTSGVGGGPLLLGSIKTSSRFATVAWTPLSTEADGSANKTFPMGLIAGGMVDGVVHFWNPAVIINNKNAESNNKAEAAAAEATALIHSIPTKSNGPVKALAFNILDTTLLAAGDSSGQVHVIDLSKMIIDNGGGSHHHPPLVSEPSPGHKQSAEITAVAWNSQVSHILASASADGSIAVWDLHSRKAWCELRAEHAGQAVADICWNPKQGLHLLSASADDRNPVLRVWDLGASTSMPVTQLQGGHGGGLFKVAWCPHDESLLLTTAKDNRTLLWDLVTMQAIGEVPNEGATPEQQQQQVAAAGGGGTAAGSLFSLSSASSFAQKHMRYDVAWSPWKRGVALTCSLDRKVQAHSILSLATRSGRPPAWMKPSSAVTTAFGGIIVSCGKQAPLQQHQNGGNPLAGPQTSSVVTIQTVSEQPFLVKTCTALETQMATAASLPEFCAMQRAAISSSSSNRTEMEIQCPTSTAGALGLSTRRNFRQGG